MLSRHFLQVLPERYCVGFLTRLTSRGPSTNRIKGLFWAISPEAIKRKKGTRIRISDCSISKNITITAGLITTTGTGISDNKLQREGKPFIAIYVNLFGYRTVFYG